MPKDKRVTLKEAVTHIKDGINLGIGGFVITRCLGHHS